MRLRQLHICIVVRLKKKCYVVVFVLLPLLPERLVCSLGNHLYLL